MPSQFDPSDFVDSDFQDAKQSVLGSASPASPVATGTDFQRAPTRQEIDERVDEKQGELARLKRAQEELERERNLLEDLRRRRLEFQTGREELMAHLTRGSGLLEEAEEKARRDAEQMAKALAALREGLGKIQTIDEEHWTAENLSLELTRALTTLENARMEWNSARLKFPVLSGETSAGANAAQAKTTPLVGNQTTAELFKLGLALTWPLVLLSLAIFLVLLTRH